MAVGEGRPSPLGVTYASAFASFVGGDAARGTWPLEPFVLHERGAPGPSGYWPFLANIPWIILSHSAAVRLRTLGRMIPCK